MKASSESLDAVKSRGADVLLIAYPLVLGDNYEEILESLSRLAASNVALRIARRQDDVGE